MHIIRFQTLSTCSVLITPFLTVYALTVIGHGQSFRIILLISWFQQQVSTRDIWTLLLCGLTLFFDKNAGTGLVLHIYISLCHSILLLCSLWLLDETTCDVLYLHLMPIVWIPLNGFVHCYAYLLKVLLPHACILNS